MTRIPHTAHFVFGLRPQVEPFHLVQYLAIASCAESPRGPSAIMLPLRRAAVRLLLGSRPALRRAAPHRAGRRRGHAVPLRRPGRPSLLVRAPGRLRAPRRARRARWASTPTSTRCSSRPRPTRSGTHRASSAARPTCSIHAPGARVRRCRTRSIMAEPGACLRRALAGRDRGRARRFVERAQLLPRRRSHPALSRRRAGGTGTHVPRRSRRRPTASAACSSSARRISPAWSRSTSPPTSGGRRPDATSARCTPAQIDERWIRAGATTYAARRATLPSRPWLLLSGPRGAAVRRRGRARPATATPPTVWCGRSRASGTPRSSTADGRTRAPVPTPALVPFSRDPLPRERDRPAAHRPSRTSSPSTTRSCARSCPTARSSRTRCGRATVSPGTGPSCSTPPTS